jgi:prepilin peptidase CpaA
LISIGLLALFPIHVWASPTPVDWISALLVAAAGFAVGFVLFARGLVGGGDVKLLSATMLWAGATLVASQLIIMALVGGALSVAAIAIHYFRRRTADAAAPKVPYGIAIAAGAGYAGMKLLIG